MFVRITAKLDLGLLCLRDEKSSAERVVPGPGVGGIASRDFPAGRMVLVGLDCGCSPADCALEIASGRGSAGGRRSEAGSSLAVAGFLAGLSLRNPVVRRNLLLGV